MTQPTPPPHASDPAVLTDGTVVPREVPPSVGGGSFTVDLEHAPQAIRELETAREQLKVLRRDALSLGNVRSPSSDQVSRDAADALGAVAVGGAGSLLAALDGGVRRLDGLIGNLRIELHSYREVDGAASSLLLEQIL